MARKKRIRRSAALWRSLVSRQASSGVTVAEYCRREKINAGVFHRWRTVLQDGDQAAGHASVAAPVAEAAPFIDLGGLAPRGSRYEVRLELGAGMVLSIARG